MTLRKFLGISLLVILLLPVVIYQAKKIPFWLLAHEIVSDAPGVNKLIIRIDPIGFESFPSVYFEYETPLGPYETQSYFQKKLESLEFKKEEEYTVYGERRSSYRDDRFKRYCDFTWRFGVDACMPGYKRKDCNPDFNVVLGSCVYY